ncbi:MAG: hydroxymethylglutaryl-CoA lyase, partial [Actinomycetota bacterium]|nr:hydroxymethylglutaryl-CoA lyase [Actinomycetota bacterium]
MGDGAGRPLVTIVEVSARDGLQNESVEFSTAEKVRLIEAGAAAGLRRIESCSFVNPKRVPQMADAEAVMESLSP